MPAPNHTEPCDNPSRRMFLRGRTVPNVSVPALDPGAPMRAQFSPKCLAQRNVVCRSCGEICEVAAIRFSPRIGGAALPAIQDSTCTGCGECLPVCPTQAISLVNYSTEAA